MQRQAHYTFPIWHYDIARGKNSSNFLEKHTQASSNKNNKPINKHINISINLRPVGQPNMWVRVNHDLIGYTRLSDSICLNYRVGLLDTINITIEL